MTLAHLGAPIDLHGGGKDLVFPHHTNEIAQSAAAVGDGRTAESFCRHWMHHGFVEIDSEKMSKSLGNFFTLRDVLAKFDAEGVRLFFLGTHYRNPINYSDAILVEAERRLNYFYETLEKVDALAAGARRQARAGGRRGRAAGARRRLQRAAGARRPRGGVHRRERARRQAGRKTPEERAAPRGVRARRARDRDHARGRAAPACGGAARHPREGCGAARNRSG